MFKKLIFSLGVIFFGLIVGYLIQQLESRKIIRLPISIENLRKLLQKVALLFFLPISTIGTLWIIKMDNIKIVALPFLGIFALFAGGVLGLVAAKLLKLNRKDTGSMFTCGSFANIASIGGLVCYLFFGEEGFALVSFYALFIQITYYIIGFPIAKSFSSDMNTNGNLASHLKKVFSDIFVVVALIYITIGILFNLSGMIRPIFYQTINAVFIPLQTMFMLVSIGLAMKFGRVRNFARECVIVSFIKFTLVPLIVSTVAFFLGYEEIEGGLPLKVVIVLSSMPVAFTSLIPVSIYNLNLDMANSCWLVTTLSLIIVLPLLFYITSLV
jgi:predicted permease